MYYNTDVFLKFWSLGGCKKYNNKRERREIFYI